MNLLASAQAYGRYPCAPSWYVHATPVTHSLFFLIYHDFGGMHHRLTLKC